MGMKEYTYARCDYCENTTTPMPTNIMAGNPIHGWHKLFTIDTEQVGGKKIKYGKDAEQPMIFCCKACLHKWLGDKIGVVVPSVKPASPIVPPVGTVTPEPAPVKIEKKNG